MRKKNELHIDTKLMLPIGAQRFLSRRARRKLARGNELGGFTPPRPVWGPPSTVGWADQMDGLRYAGRLMAEYPGIFTRPFGTVLYVDPTPQLAMVSYYGEMATVFPFPGRSYMKATVGTLDGTPERCWELYIPDEIIDRWGWWLRNKRPEAAKALGWTTPDPLP